MERPNGYRDVGLIFILRESYSMSTYYRCSHCRGFYETDLERCKYCRYTTVTQGVNGTPRVFPDRESCRVIQIAEYEQLPPEAMADHFRPPSDELAEPCGCLHCGPDSPAFEAVEMRWMVNEQMWACPCTTCGGRGFDFDIHPIAARWECIECGKKWRPPDDNFKPSNCKCPVCGCVNANGWFDDEHSEEEIEAMTEEEYVAAFGMTRAEEEEKWAKYDREFDEAEKQKIDDLLDEPNSPMQQSEPRGSAGGFVEEEDIPFGPESESSAREITDYDPERRLGETNAEDLAERSGLPDDIDFPRSRRKDVEGPSGEDIPY